MTTRLLSDNHQNIKTRHTYEDWIRHKCGLVAVLADADLRNYVARIKFHDGKIIECSIFDYDLITEYEYWKQIDATKCGEDIPDLVAAYKINAPEDFFTGGYYRNSIMQKPKGEDFFS